MYQFYYNHVHLITVIFIFIIFKISYNFNSDSNSLVLNQIDFDNIHAYHLAKKFLKNKSWSIENLKFKTNLISLKI
jgi:hypothetical protein